jgi:hypothetical protein
MRSEHTRSLLRHPIYNSHRGCPQATMPASCSSAVSAPSSPVGSALVSMSKARCGLRLRPRAAWRGRSLALRVARFYDNTGGGFLEC